jgi:hypothetical protein
LPLCFWLPGETVPGTESGADAGTLPAAPFTPYGTSTPFGPQRPPAKSTPWVPLAAKKGTRCCVGEHAATFSPPHTRSCAAPAAAKPVFVRSVLANLPECAADTRPAATRADRDNCRCCSKTEAPVTCSPAGRLASTGRRWLVLPSGSGQFGISSKPFLLGDKRRTGGISKLAHRRRALLDIVLTFS